MAQDFVWAVDRDGRPTKCTAKPENRGKGRCPHGEHQKEGQTAEEFFKQISNSKSGNKLDLETQAKVNSAVDSQLDDWAKNGEYTDYLMNRAESQQGVEDSARISLAKHSTDPAILTRLYDENPYTHKYLAEHSGCQNFPSDIAEKLSNSEDPTVRIGIAQSCKDTEVLKDLFNRSYSVKSESNITSALFDREDFSKTLSKHHDPKVRKKVANKGYQLLELSKDASEDVRAGVIDGAMRVIEYQKPGHRDGEAIAALRNIYDNHNDSETIEKMIPSRNVSFGLDKTIEHSDPMIRLKAEDKLKELGYKNINDWIRDNPELCALKENRQ